MAQNKCNEQLGGMPKLKTNCRTIIERGNEISREAVNSEDGIYAVSYMDQKGQMQWGIVVYNGVRDYILNYNVSARSMWQCGLITTMHLHFYEATQMERDFAQHYRQGHMYERKFWEMDEQLKIVMESRWHRVAETLRKFFRC